MTVIIYTTNCPQCKVLESMLKRKNILFEKCEDTDVMLNFGMRSAPYLSVDGNIMNFGQAIKWVNEVQN